MIRPSAVLLLLALGLAACDAGFDGSASDNRLPETELSVRSTDLREDLGARRLISTVDVAWSGTDPDGVKNVPGALMVWSAANSWISSGC